LRSVPV